MILDTIIIGGGISGLYTNLELCNQRDKTLLLEMSPVFGGRIYQYEDNEVSFPAGAARFNKNHKRVIKLLNDLIYLTFVKTMDHQATLTLLTARNIFIQNIETKQDLNI